MAYHIRKPSVIDSAKTVYYAKTGKWSDNYADKKNFTTKTAANKLINDSNGGFTGATAVSN